MSKGNSNFSLKFRGRERYPFNPPQFAHLNTLSDIKVPRLSRIQEVKSGHGSRHRYQ